MVSLLTNLTDIYGVVDMPGPPLSRKDPVNIPHPSPKAMHGKGTRLAKV
jgi:hypothetical protein